MFKQASSKRTGKEQQQKVLEAEEWMDWDKSSLVTIILYPEKQNHLQEEEEPRREPYCLTDLPEAQKLATAKCMKHNFSN